MVMALVYIPVTVHRFPRTMCGDLRQGSTFRVKDKEGSEDPKSSLKMLIFPSNCQFGSKFSIRPDEDDAFLANMHSKCSPGPRMEP